MGGWGVGWGVGWGIRVGDVGWDYKEMECYSINGKQTIYIKGVLKYKKN